MLSRLPGHLQTSIRSKADVFGTINNSDEADRDDKEEDFDGDKVGNDNEHGSRRCDDEDEEDDGGVDDDPVVKSQLSPEERLKKFQELLEEKKVVCVRACVQACLFT